MLNKPDTKITLDDISNQLKILKGMVLLIIKLLKSIKKYSKINAGKTPM